MKQPDPEVWYSLYSRFVREGWTPMLPFADANFPLPHEVMPTVIVPRNRLLEFRAHYAMLLGMVSALLRVSPSTLCVEDMLRAIDDPRRIQRTWDEE